MINHVGAVQTGKVSGAASGMGHGVFMTGAQTIKANNALKKLGWDKLTMEDVQEIVASGLESAQDTDAYKLALELRELLDAGKMPSKTDIVRQIQANDKAIWAEEKAEDSQAVGNEEQKTYFSMEDYANSESPVWNNVAYDDDETKAAITQQTHADMVNAGAVVAVSADVMQKVEQELPDLRSVKKNERTPILKAAFKALKNNLRQFLSGLSGQKFEFSVNGSVLEAKLYSTGINEVLEKVTKQKANMLYTTEDIFRNARYLYSTEDYGGDPNVYRWNYFYTPVQIGNDTVGVRIAVRDMVKGVGMLPESQIYNWGIKKDASLDGGRRGPKVASSDVSSDASNAIIDQGGGIVNNERNGGNENAESTGAGDRVSDGVGQRQNGMGTGKPTGSMAGRSGGAEGRNAQADARRTAINRQNRAKDLIRQGLIQKISSRELGLKNGTDAQNIAVLPQEYWDEELQQIAKEVMEETGREVTFVVGGMEIRSGRFTQMSRGVRNRDIFIVQVDNMKATARQIAEHELFHEIVHQKLLLIPQMEKQVAQSCTKEELDAVVGRYWDDMVKTMEITADTDLDRLRWKVEMEVYADAYAGIDYKGFGATQFTESVRQYARQENQRRTKWQANGVRQTNGPNATQENTALDDGVQYSLCEFEKDGRRYVVIDQEQDRFDGKPLDEYPRIAKDIINERFNGKVIGIDNKMFVNGSGRDEFVNPSKPLPNDLYEAKLRTAGELDNLLDAGTNFRNEPDGKDGHYHPDVVGGFDYFDTLFEIGGRYFEATINIKNVKKGKLFKDVTKIKDVTQAIMSSYGKNPKSQFLRTSSINSIRNPDSFVKQEDEEEFSMDEGEVSRIDGEMAAEMKRWEDMYLENRLGKEGAKE